jgi:hypothetical protein
VKEYRAALGARAVLVEARIRARIDGRIGGVARDQLVNAVPRILERQTRSSRRMRA